MFKKTTLALLAGASSLIAVPYNAFAIDAAPMAEPTVIYTNQPAPPPPVRTAYVQQHANMGGGLIEFLFGDGPASYGAQQPPVYQQQPDYYGRGRALPPMDPQQQMIYQQEQAAEDPRQRPFDPKYEKQLVDYQGREHAGTIIIDTPNKFLYLVQGDGKALRYGVGVGKPGFAWSGVKTVSAKREWPDWTPPAEMLARRPDLPRHMEGGPDNPLGARAMYLGSSLYRIHGSNEPWTIGTNVSSGCIRMRNEDVIDLYGRVNVGAKVVVM
ncbi:L,D-transpeptidase [Bradyrhizobium jicamae]|uniref:L,D-transpeptidase n=1 Tax=Bradyrhizobium jicamae TaxID=280332 RepID=A0ABS5FK07_9BRAD|nr:L,D-transpeptidase [Bradyrhizobium jicamae]MBR0797119.1 L,D-transpeptidase [Bradyrhizobium jicamae]MBR0937623.1 L,D-transpeptidase [Bradyrhizobium jicamae]